MVSTPGGRGPAIGYAPVSNAAYTLYRLDSLTLHLPGGAQQRQALERTAFLRVTVGEGTGNGFRVTIILDSLRATATAASVSPDSLAPLRGMRWVGTLSSTGQLSTLAADRSTTMGNQLTHHLRLLFPVLPVGGARAGAEWSDSVSFPLKADAFNATEQAKTTYRALEDGKGLKIESRGTYRRSGSEIRREDRLEMTATGKREGVAYFSREGRLLSAQGHDVGGMTIVVPKVGQTVPVNQWSRYEIRASGSSR